MPWQVSPADAVGKEELFPPRELYHFFPQNWVRGVGASLGEAKVAVITAGKKCWEHFSVKGLEGKEGMGIRGDFSSFQTFFEKEETV